MTDLNSLDIFARVVDANSFSEAARRLKMPLSTVSRRIADLEDQLGIRLLERSTRNMRLTDAGCEVLEQARQAVELSNAVDNIISDHRSHVRGTERKRIAWRGRLGSSSVGKNRPHQRAEAR